MPRVSQAVSQQAADRSEILERQRRLPKVKSHRASPYGGEARGNEPGYLIIAVDIEDEPECLRELPGMGPEQAGREQGSHIVGAAPRDRTSWLVNRLEVEPVRDSSLEIDHHVLRHGVAMGESEEMHLAEGSHRQLDGPLPRHGLELLILQHARQRLPSQARQAEDATGIDPNRGPPQAQMKRALPLLPGTLGKGEHARVQDPRQRTTEPDQERCVEEANLSHPFVAVPARGAGGRVPRGTEHSSKSEAQKEEGPLRRLRESPQSPESRQAIPTTISSVPTTCTRRTCSPRKATLATRMST